MKDVVPIHEAKANLSALIRRACAGESVVVGRGRKPMVRLVPVDVTQGRTFGALKGQVTIDEEFFEPLPDEELDHWG